MFRKLVVALVAFLLAVIPVCADTTYSFSFYQAPETIYAGQSASIDLYLYPYRGCGIRYNVYRDGVLYLDTGYISYPYYEQNHAYIVVPQEDAGHVFGIEAWVVDGQDKTIALTEPITKDWVAAPNDFSISSVSASEAVLNLGRTAYWEADLESIPENAEITYSFSVYDYASGTLLTTMSGSNPSCSYTPNAVGVYCCTLNITDYQEGRNPVGENKIFTESIVRVIDPDTPWIEAVVPAQPAVVAGQEHTWHIQAWGGQGNLSYACSLYRDGVLQAEHQVEDGNSFTAIMTEPGEYILRVTATDENGAVSDVVSSPALVVTAGEPVLTGFTVDAPDPVYMDDQVTYTAHVVGGAAPVEYAFTLLCDEVPVQTWPWQQQPSVTVTYGKAGEYVMEVQVRDSAGNRLPAVSSDVVTVLDPTPAILRVTLGEGSAAVDAGELVRWQVVAYGGAGPLEYRYTLYSGTTVYDVVDWSGDASLAYAFMDAGEYTMTVSVRDVRGHQGQDVHCAEAVAVTDTKPSLSGVKCSVETAKVGEACYWLPTGCDGTGLQYWYRIFCDGECVIDTGWEGPRVYELTFAEVGSYYAMLKIRDGNGDETAWVTGTTIAVDSVPEVMYIGFYDTTQKVGLPYKAAAVTRHGEEPLEFKFCLYLDYGYQAYYPYRQFDWSTDHYVEGVFDRAGSYRFSVIVRDADGDTCEEYNGPAFTVRPGVIVNGISSDVGEALIKQPVTWTVDCTTGVGDMTYAYTIYRNGEAYRTPEPSFSNTLTYAFEEGGVYTVEVIVSDEEISAEPVRSAEVVITDPSPVMIGVTSEKTEMLIGQSNSWTVQSQGGTAPLEYFGRLMREGELYRNLGWQAESVFTASIADGGLYTLEVRASDSAGYTSAFMASPVLKVTDPSPVLTRVDSEHVQVSLGGTNTWTAHAEGGSEPLTYQAWLYLNGEQIHAFPQQHSAVFSCTLDSCGEYCLHVQVLDSAGYVSGIVASDVVTVPDPSPVLTMVGCASEEVGIFQEAVWNAVYEGGTAPLSFTAWLTCNGQEYLTLGPQASPEFRCMLDQTGSYVLTVQIAGADGYTSDKVASAAVTVPDPSPVITDVLCSCETAVATSAITWTVAYTGGYGKVSFEAELLLNGAVVHQFPPQESDRFTYTCLDVGEYVLRVKAIDEAGFVSQSAESAVVSITALENPVEAITLYMDQYELLPGFEYYAYVQIQPEDADVRTVTFASTDEKVVTVDAQGWVRARNPGSAVISATAHNGLTARVNVTVVPIEFVVYPEEENLVLEPGHEVRFEMYVTSEGYEGVEMPVVYASSNPYVMPVPNYVGDAYGENPGFTWITMSITGTDISVKWLVEVLSYDQVRLPDGLTVVEPDAFRGTAVTCVIIPESVRTIGAKAFADCTRLGSIVIPAGVQDIAADAFSGSDHMTLVVSEGSAAHQYALKYGVPYVIR